MKSSPTLNFRDAMIMNRPAVTIENMDIIPQLENHTSSDFLPAKTDVNQDGQRNKLTLSNLKMVSLIAQHYKEKGLPFLDLVQEGVIGLMIAIEKFDPRKGNQLSTYSAWWIKQSMARALSNQSRTIRLPVHVVEALSKIKRVQSRLQNQYNRQPNDYEVASALNSKVSKIDSILNASLPCFSLDYSGYEDGNLTLTDNIPDKASLSPEELADFHFIRKQLSRHMEFILNDREKNVLMLRFGLGKEMGEKTLNQVGSSLNLTENQVRKASSRALRKLRSKMKRDSFEEYLN